MKNNDLKTFQNMLFNMKNKNVAPSEEFHNQMIDRRLIVFNANFNSISVISLRFKSILATHTYMTEHFFGL